MVTVLGPTKRRVSIWAKMELDWPARTTACGAVAVVQPQETRTPVMRTSWPVLLVKRYEWVTVGPRGTGPKSWPRPSNIASAQVAAGAAVAKVRPATAAKQN